MIKNFFNARLFAACAFLFLALESSALTLRTKPIEPEAFGKTTLVARYDASDTRAFSFTATGGVETWATSLGDENTLKAVIANSNVKNIIYGKLGYMNGAVAYKMGSPGSNIDMAFTSRITNARTVFWAMDIKTDGLRAFFLGDTSGYNFHRGEGGQYAYSSGGFQNASIRCDGTQVENPQEAIPPTGLHVYSAKMPANAATDRLSQDRNQALRNGGRDLSELIIFSNELSDEEISEVEAYLSAKWIGTEENPSSWGNVIEVDEDELTAATINAFLKENGNLVDARLKLTKPLTLTLDAPLSAKKLYLEGGSVTVKLAEGGVSSDLKKLDFNYLDGNLDVSDFEGEMKLTSDGLIELGEESSITIFSDYGETRTIAGIKGGKVIKTGEGTLSVKRVGDITADGVTFEIEAGTITFNEENSQPPALNDVTFRLKANTILNNFGWIKITGTLTLESDADLSIFANTGTGATGSANNGLITGGPSIVKKGSGRIVMLAGSEEEAGTARLPFTDITVEDGTLAFGGMRTKIISGAISGPGYLEELGTGVMTFKSSATLSENVALHIKEGSLVNDIPGGSLTCAALEIDDGASYTTKAYDLHLAKSFALSGDGHPGWVVTLADNAKIATSPLRAMTISKLILGSGIILGADQTVGSTLAKTASKPSGLDTLIVKSEDASLNLYDYQLSYEVDSLIVTRKGIETPRIETIPGIGLNGAIYKVYGEKAGTWVRVSVGGRVGEAEVITHADGGTYATIANCGGTAFIGNGQAVKVEFGINGVNGFEVVDSYSDVSLNVRPEPKNEGWIDERTYSRWNTGSWDTEGDYIEISDGFIQVEGADKAVSFTPTQANSDDEAAFHFSVIFGDGLKLEILNALVDENQIAGLAIEESEGSYHYAVIDPSTHEYVEATLDKRSAAKVDPKVEHLVEIVIVSSSKQKGIAYKVDGASLTVNDKNILSIPETLNAEIAKIDFLGRGSVKAMSAEEYSTKLAKYEEKEYATIEAALEAALAEADESADTLTIEPLWNANWTPSTNLVGKTIIFSGNYKVEPKTINQLAKENMVLRPNADGSYSIISKFLTVTIPDPEELDGFGVFLESVTTNSMHLGWVYDYKSDKPKIAKATVVYGDDVTISFSTTIDNGANGALLVAREGAEDGEGNPIAAGTQIKSITFHQVRYDTEVASKHIPVLGGENMDSVAKAKVKALYDYGIAAPKAMTADINIIDFTAASDGVTFNIAALDGVSDAEKIAAVSNLVWFSTDLKNWELVADDGIRINEDGSITVKQVGSTGFYKVSIR